MGAEESVTFHTECVSCHMDWNDIWNVQLALCPTESMYRVLSIKPNKEPPQILYDYCAHPPT